MRRRGRKPDTSLPCFVFVFVLCETPSRGLSSDGGGKEALTGQECALGGRLGLRILPHGQTCGFDLDWDELFTHLDHNPSPLFFSSLFFACYVGGGWYCLRNQAIKGKKRDQHVRATIHWMTRQWNTTSCTPHDPKQGTTNKGGGKRTHSISGPAFRVLCGARVGPSSLRRAPELLRK